MDDCECYQTYTYYAWSINVARNLDATTYTIQMVKLGTIVNNNVTFKTTVADSNSLISNYTWISSKDGYIGTI